MKASSKYLIIHFVIPLLLGGLLTLLIVFFTRFKSPSQIHWHLFIGICLAIWLIWILFYLVFTSALKLQIRKWTLIIFMRAILAVALGIVAFDLIYVGLKLFEIWHFGSIDYLQMGHLIAASGVGLFAVLIVGGIQGGIFFIKFWLDEKVNREIAEKELNQNRLHLLRQQLDPHFVFNSFSTLDSLIHQDAERASKFLHKLSVFYQMVLSTYEKDLILLKEELKLTGHYIDLLKIRFPDGFAPIIVEKKPIHEQLVPPLSIQLLIENAVKHNAFGKEKPLELLIETDGDIVLIKNNKRIKARVNEPSGIGLKNLERRFKLHNLGFSIKETPSIYQVTFSTIS